MPDRELIPALYRPQYLRALGFEATTIIDIGVRAGTPALYKAFPDARFVLVDPQAGADLLLVHRPARYVFKNVAVGAQPSRMELHPAGGQSSLLERTELTATRRNAPAVEVEVTTLDNLISELGAKAGLLGIKIDTEGFEMEVLRGLDQHAAAVEFLICEVSVRQRFVKGYTFAELVTLVHSKGFEFYNFLNKPQRHPRFYDCLFVRQEHSLLR